MLTGVAAGQVESVPTPLDDIVGIYQEGGDRLRVTWRPDGGLYVLGLDAVYTRAHGGPAQSVIAAGSDGGLAWDGATVELRREGDRVVALEIADATRARTLRRLDREPYSQRQVAWRNGDVRLVGTVLLPGGDGPFPGAAIIQGSGASSRSNLWAWTFADGLAMRGVAVLLPDKRGSGQSGGDWLTADFDLLAADAAASLAVLRSFDQVDGERSGLVGLSQGGWIAPVAARAGSGAFAVSLVTAFATPKEQILHDVLMSLRRGGMAEQQLARARELLTMLAGYIESGQGWEAYQHAAKAFRAGLPAAAAEAFPLSKELPMLALFAKIFDFDYGAALRAYDGPVYLMLGAVDHLDNVPIDVTLRRTGEFYAADPHADLQLQVYAKMGHALGESDVGWVSPKVLDDLASWIVWRTGSEH